MKKSLWPLLLLLISTIALTGCSFGAEVQAEEERALRPLDPETWPTPPPAAAPATPTPFPKITLAPTATPTARSTPTPPATPPVLNSLSAGDAAVGLAEQVGALSSSLSPAAAAFVTGSGATMRQGPGESYAAVSAIEPGELAAVLGKNPGGDWLYVITASLQPGWLPAGSLRVTGDLEKAPVLPPNPLAALTRPGQPGAEAAGGAPVAPVQPLVMADLKPVAAARVNSEALNMRQGPGAAYKILGTLSANDRVNVLALNKPGDWALVQTAEGKFGWVYLNLLSVEGTLTNAPRALSAAPDQTLPANQVAPIFDLNGPETTGETGPPSSAETAPVEAIQAAYSPAAAPASSPGDLTPVATARIKRTDLELRPGPGTEYAAIDKLTDEYEEIAILGLDKSGHWALVKPARSAGAGWVALNELIVDGDLVGAPQVFTAWVESNAIEVRRGPGIYHDVVGTLAINTLLPVLGLDESRSWALVKPVSGGGWGWAPIRFLKVGGRWADVPAAPELLPSEPTEAVVQAPQPSLLPIRPISASKIVFQRSSGGDIMVINSDGSGLRRLTSGIDPVLSPDGQTVAFTRWQGETGSLWLIGVDGSNERQVLGFIKQAKGPEWSPDGSQIVLNFQHEGRLESKKNCFDIGKAPRPPRNATDIGVEIDEDFEPRLCWKIPPDPHWGLRVVNLADGSFEDLYGGQYAFRPAWDPVQPWRIVADAGNGLLETDINRDYHRNITAELNDSSPVFSPDGRYLAVAIGQPGGSSGYDIHRLNADGSGRVQLTKTPLWVPVQPDRQKPWNNVSPAWSPEGSQIAFLTDRTGRWEIWVVNADGSDQRPMFSDAVNDQLQISYNFVDERALSWR